jgi:hypothetical protein
VAVSPWAWRALGIGLMLGFVASGLAASRLHRRPRVGEQILAAAVFGGIPAVAIFTIAWVLPGGGHVVGLAFGCGVGGILGTAGAWVMRERGDGRLRPALAFVGTLAGATLGSAIGAAVVFALYVADGQLVPELMLPLAAAYVGSFAALGFQIGAG